MNSEAKHHTAINSALTICGFFILLVGLTAHVQADTPGRQEKLSGPAAADLSEFADSLTSSSALPDGRQNAPESDPSNPGGAEEDANLLLFAARAVDTRMSYPMAEAMSREGKALHMIQFVGPIQDSWLTAVGATGAEPIHYIANYGYLVWAGHASRMQLDQLAAKGDILKFSAPYSADLRSDPTLSSNRAQMGSDDTLIVTIQMLRHDGDRQTKRILDGLIIEQLSPWEPVLKYQNSRASVSASSLTSIKSLPDVIWIEPYQEPRLQDEKQTQILVGNLNSQQTEPAGPGYLDWLREKGFRENPAGYPIIDITDDGIGNGIAETAAGDGTFRVTGNPDLDSRISYLANCTDAADGSGADGHGHLNASITGGYDQRAGTPYQDSEGYQRGMGANPFGRIAGTRVFNGPRFDLSNCGSSSMSLLRQSYQSGARIVSNSWGCTTPSCTTAYNTTAQAYDAGVRDADSSSPGNQEMLILFSAGNVASAGVGSPANAKNVIAVGASENVRPTWFDSCGYGPQDADNVQDLARYSSRGPAPGGRIKPDLVAPGTHVTGTASTSPVYNGSAICDQFHPNDQQVFTASTGTSHSVPAVAGIASLATFWLNENFGIADPSPALLKAYLVSSTSYLSGEGANDDLPSNNQGFGLPDMNRAFSDSSRIVVEQDDVPLFDDSGQTWSFRARSVDGNLPLRIVMAYTDQPGSASTSDPRVNDLDLVVVQNGATYAGNSMDGQWSQPGGQADRLNNIEAVFLPSGKMGSIEITVRATNIGGDGVPGEGDETDQDFALICDNCEYEIGHEYKFFFPIFPAE